MKEICSLCGDAPALDHVEVCSACATDARLLGKTASLLAPEAHRQALAQVPDWAERHREAQRSGEMFAEGYRGDGR